MKCGDILCPCARDATCMLWETVLHRLMRLEAFAMQTERRMSSLLTRSEPGPIDLDQLVRRVEALENVRK